MGRLMRRLTTFAMIGAGAWSLWWYVGARGQETGIAVWLDTQRNRGWVAEAGAVEIEGYPTDFEMRAVDIVLSDPRAGWLWSAPELLAASRAYSPTRIAVSWPREQMFAVPGDRTRIRSEKMETILDLRPGPAMELRQAATVVAALVIDAQSGWQAGARRLVANLAEDAGDQAPANSYSLHLEAAEVILPPQLVAAIDPTGWLKPRIDRLTVLTHGTLGAALGRETIETGVVALHALTISEASFEWGKMRLSLRGALTVDDQGFPVGKIDIEVREWRQMVRLARRSGLIDRQIARSITKAVELATALAGSGEVLNLTIRFRGGKIRLGPVAIADAPQLAPASY